MNPTRRGVLAGGLGLATTAHAASIGHADAALFETLDATGPLLAGAFHPARVLDSMRALIALSPTERIAALRRYLAVRVDPPRGLFAVLRGMVQVPSRELPRAPFPGVLSPGFLRPPGLGASSPPQPDDLQRVPRWPLILLGDVPLSLVRGYVLGGLPEPLWMHLDGLEGAIWRTQPLAPISADEVRHQLTHWGRWSDNAASAWLLEAQLDRLEGG